MGEPSSMSERAPSVLMGTVALTRTSLILLTASLLLPGACSWKSDRSPSRLEAPQGVTATLIGADIHVDWQPVPGATSYNIYWSNQSGLDKSARTLIPGVQPPYPHTGLTLGLTYYYIVTALRGPKEGPPSVEAFAVGPPCPTQLAVLDTSFGGVGWIVERNTAGVLQNDIANGVTMDAVGRIIVTGRSFSIVGREDMTIWRLLEDGALDLALNGTGWVSHDIAAGGGAFDEGYDVALDSRGRIVVSGVSLEGVPRGYDVAVWRYSDDGSPDTSFGGSGVVTHDGAVGTAAEDWGLAMVVDDFDRVVVTGISQISSHDMALWRFREDGSLDTSFNGQGWTTHDANAGSANAHGRGVTLDSSGRILVTGEVFSPTGGMAVWRYHDDGTLDPSLDGTGWAIYQTGGSFPSEKGLDIVVDGGDKILVCGQAPGNLKDLCVWRLNDDGSLDVTFGGQGWVTHDGLGLGGMQEGLAIALYPCGGIIVVGRLYNNFASDMAVWKFRDDGTLDMSFNGQGYFSHHGAAGASGADFGQDLVLDDRGRIVVAGWSNANPYADMVVWRLR